MPNYKTNSPYVGSGQLTREQFLFYEMRTTANLVLEGFTDKEIVQKIEDENLFQYPTKRTIRTVASACVSRIRAMDSPQLTAAIVEKNSDVAKQICLYAMMRRYRLVRDFFTTVIGRKFQQQDYTFHRRDVLIFLAQLSEQDDYVAGWSESTIKKIASVLMRLLVETEYIENGKATNIQPVLIDPMLEEEIREAKEEDLLCAFHCYV